MYVWKRRQKGGRERDREQKKLKKKEKGKKKRRERKGREEKKGLIHLLECPQEHGLSQMLMPGIY